MARVDELFTEISNHFDEFKANHETFNEKGNKAAAGRARKAIGEIKKLVQYMIRDEEIWYLIDQLPNSNG